MPCFNISMLNCTMSQSIKDTESKMLCSFYLEETQLDPISSQSEVISKYYEESIQTSLLSIQIDEYEMLNAFTCILKGVTFNFETIFVVAVLHISDQCLEQWFPATNLKMAEW